MIGSKKTKELERRIRALEREVAEQKETLSRLLALPVKMIYEAGAMESVNKPF